MVWSPLSIKGQGRLDHNGGKLVWKHSWWSNSWRCFLKKVRLPPWMGEGNLLAQIGSCNVLWIPSITNVFPLSSGDNQGGYGVVHEVWIKKFDHFPITIELVGKTPKTDDKWKMHKQRLVEALTHLCEHLGVIKFLTIHAEIMEAYKLWSRTKELFKKCWITTQTTPSLWIIEPYCNKGAKYRRVNTTCCL
jgi:hypothetical protein